MSTKIICNLEAGTIQEVPLSSDELTELAERRANALLAPTAPTEPTKEELLAELQALTAKINALG